MTYKMFSTFLHEAISNISGDAEPSPQSNPTDTVTLDVPLLIRLLEFAKEDAQDDMTLHSVTENMVNLSTPAKKTPAALATGMN